MPQELIINNQKLTSNKKNSKIKKARCDYNAEKNKLTEYEKKKQVLVDLEISHIMTEHLPKMIAIPNIQEILQFLRIQMPQVLGSNNRVYTNDASKSTIKTGIPFL